MKVLRLFDTLARGRILDIFKSSNPKVQRYFDRLVDILESKIFPAPGIEGEHFPPTWSMNLMTYLLRAVKALCFGGVITGKIWVSTSSLYSAPLEPRLEGSLLV